MAARVYSLASGSVLKILTGGLYPRSGNCYVISGRELLTAVCVKQMHGKRCYRSHLLLKSNKNPRIIVKKSRSLITIISWDAASGQKVIS